MSSASESEFRNSFANLDSNAVAEENKRDLLKKQNSDFDANLEDAEVLRISSSEPPNTETTFGNNQAATIRTDKESPPQDRATPETPLKQRLPSTISNEKSLDQPDLLHYTLLRFMKMSEERFDDLERQMATVIKQQTRILQQHGAILDILCDRKPVTPAGNTKEKDVNANHLIVASTVSPPLSDGVQEIEPSPGKKLKERSKSKYVSPPAKVKDASSPAAKLEKASVPVEPDPDKFALEYRGNAVASAAVATGDDPTVGSSEDYEMKLGGGKDAVDHQSVDDDTVIAANPPNVGVASPRGNSPTTTTTTTTTSTTTGRTTIRRGSGELRRSSTRKSATDASASSGGGSRRDESVTPSKPLRRRGSQRHLLSAERSQGRVLSISPTRRSNNNTRANRAHSADGDEMLMTMMMLSRSRVATTPRRENRVDSANGEEMMMTMNGSSTTAPQDSEQGPNGVEHKSRRGSSRRSRGDGDELSSSRNGGLDAKQDKKKEKRKLKKRSSRKGDFAIDEDEDNNS
ncbi:hypothetical protein MHU86_23412 [Fragilaria crotonensis]|nr:hypothetical protein MHU86_23412 [Fragilaria crotonensis]